MTMTAVLLLVLVVCILYLALRVRALKSAVSTLARIVDKPRRRDRTLRKEIRSLKMS
jgi:cell division protein FtsL